MFLKLRGGVGVCFADFISFFINYSMKMEKLGRSETKLFHFHWFGLSVRIFKNVFSDHHFFKIFSRKLTKDIQIINPKSMGLVLLGHTH